MLKLWAIAFYEAKSLMRSTVFKVFGSIAILLFLMTFFRQLSWWGLQKIPSQIPYLIFLFLNLLQSLFAFLVAMECYTDITQSTASLHVRSYSNAVYVVGKIAGIGIVFLLINLSIICCALVLNIVFLHEFPVYYKGYFVYPLVFSFPTLVYVFGLTFFVLQVVRSKAFASVLLLLYFSATVLAYGNQAPYLFDFSGLKLPLGASDFVGYGNIPYILMQRAVYVLLGLSFMFAAISLYRFSRLPQSKKANSIVFLLCVIFLGSGGIIGKSYIGRYTAGVELRKEMWALNKKEAEKPELTVTDCTIDMTHEDENISVAADVRFINNTGNPIFEYIFSLNPGLLVKKIVRNGDAIEFTRNLHIISIMLPEPLESGQADSLTIQYAGIINEDACYSDIDENIRRVFNRHSHFNSGKRYAFVTPRYVLLTPESLWYPVGGVPYSSAYPKSLGKDFVNYELTVHSANGLVPISQGKSVQLDNGEFHFKPETRLPQLSLAIGNYEKKSITVDGIDYALFMLEKHDCYSKHFADLSDKKIHETITELKQKHEIALGFEYPFKRFSLVEVPLQFVSERRLWTLAPDTVQPEQIFLCENSIPDINVYTEMISNRAFLSPEEIQTILFRHFIQYFLLEVQSSFEKTMQEALNTQKNVWDRLDVNTIPVYRYDTNIFPQYYCFVNQFVSYENPMFGLAFGLFIKSNLSHYTYYEEEYIRSILLKHTLQEIISDPRRKPLFSILFERKSEELFGSLAGQIGNDTFHAFIRDYMEKHKFSYVSSDDFFETIKDKYGIDFSPYIDQWYTQKQFPKFEVYDAKRTKVVKDNREIFHITYKIYNSGQNGGSVLVWIGGKYENIRQHIYLEANQAKEIGLYADLPEDLCSIVSFRTYTALNDKFLRLSTGKFRDYNPRAEYFVGERIIENLPKEIDSAIIVDDADKGFTVVSQPQKTILEKILKRDLSYADDLYEFDFHNPPRRWSVGMNSEFWGELGKTAHYKVAGKGNLKVAWNVELPEEAAYDVFVHTINKFRLQIPTPGEEQFAVDDFHYMVRHGDGIDEVICDMKKTKDGWTYLGTYYFLEGMARVELTDQTDGKIVYADAVKWVKKL